MFNKILVGFAILGVSSILDSLSKSEKRNQEEISNLTKKYSFLIKENNIYIKNMEKDLNLTQEYYKNEAVVLYNKKNELKNAEICKKVEFLSKLIDNIRLELSSNSINELDKIELINIFNLAKSKLSFYERQYLFYQAKNEKISFYL